MQKLSQSQIHSLLSNPKNLRHIGITGCPSLQKQTFINMLCFNELQIEEQNSYRYGSGRCYCDRCYECDCRNSTRRVPKEEMKMAVLGGRVQKLESELTKEIQKNIKPITYKTYNRIVNLLQCNLTAQHRPGYRFHSAMKLIDGLLIVVPSSPGCSFVEQILTICLCNHVKPIFVIDVGDVQKGQYKKAMNNVRELLEMIEGLMGSIRERKATEIYSFDLSDVIIANNDHIWAFALNEYIAQVYSTTNEHIFTCLGKYYDVKNGQWRVLEEVDWKVKDILEDIGEFLECLKQCSTTNQHKAFEQKLQFSLHKITQNQTAVQRQLMRRWLYRVFPLSTSIIQRTLVSVPSPDCISLAKIRSIVCGQNYEIVDDLLNCNEKGPLLAYAAVDIEAGERETMRVARIFSGNLSLNSQKIKIYELGQSRQMTEKNQRFSTLYGIKLTSIGCLGAGNLILLRQCWFSPQTTQILTNKTVDPLIFKATSVEIRNCVRTTLQPKQAKNLPSLLEGIKKQLRVGQFDIRYEIQQSGSHQISANCKDEIEGFVAEVANRCSEIVVEDIQPIYMEIMTEKSSSLCMTKSQNKHNRLYGSAEPLPKFYIQELKKLPKNLVNEYEKIKKFEESGWDVLKDGKIWSFGNEHIENNNILINCLGKANTSNPLQEIRESCIASFNWTIKEGVLCEERQYGVVMKLLDCELISDAIHRGGGQIMPAFRRLCYGAFLQGRPSIVEPYTISNLLASEAEKEAMLKENPHFKIIQQHPFNASNNKYTVISPSVEWRFSDLWRSSVRNVEIEWRQVQGYALDVGSPAYEIVMKLRGKKGLNLNLPELTNFIDTL